MSAKLATDQPVSDDQELAQVLASNTAEQNTTPAASTDAALGGLQFEESPVPAQSAPTPAPTSTLPTITPSPSAAAASTSTLDPTAPDPISIAPSAPSVAPLSSPTPGAESLETIKKDALEELRPLVTKLDLPPEEKFDTLLLIIRSTDDQSLLGAAHDAAKSIADETRRAQALLDVIKEIDFFSGQAQPSANSLA